MTKYINTTIFAALALTLFSSVSAAAVPAEMHFQGVLTDNEGAPLSGQHSITVSLYDAQQGGALLWTQVSQLEVVGGVVDLVLGESTSISADILSSPQLWLGVQVDGDDELTPRQKLASVPYAARAAVADTAANVPDAALVAQWADQAGYALEADLADQSPATAPMAWAGLVGVPAGFADGTDDGLTADAVLQFLVDYGYVTDDVLLDLVTYQYLEANYTTTYDIMALIASYYTKEELDILLDARPELNDVLALLAGYYTREEMDTLLAGYAAWDHTHAWETLTDVPEGFADGVDNDTTYTAHPAGGLELSDGAFQLLTSCGDGQVLKWDGGLLTWMCADDFDAPEVGDIEAVVAGAGLLGGATSGTATLTVDSATVQRRVSGACPQGGIGSVNEDGSVTCALERDTLGGLTCADGQVAKYSTLTLAWSCADDLVGAGDVTAVVAGQGLTGGAMEGSVQLAVDPTVVQSRVTGTCANGGIASISQSGTVTCDVDADTLGGLTCPAGRVAKWNGSSWACAADRGLVAVTQVDGAVPILAAGAAWTMVSEVATATVTVEAGQTIIATSTVALGTGAAAAAGLDLGMCITISTATVPVVPNANWLEDLQLAANQRIGFTVMNVLTGTAAGSYKVGPCYRTTNTNWNWNNWGQTIVTVFQP